MRKLGVIGLAMALGCNGKAVGVGDTAAGTDGNGNPTTGNPNGGGGGAYHPEGWADPTVHGLTTKLQNGVDDEGGDCRDCHGSKLEGDGTALACASCHGDGWTTDCTFCHGDPADGTGSPPRDINDEDRENKISFPQHRVHVDEGTIHADYDCTMCHAKPTDALTKGHLFDDKTSGRAEVKFDGGSYDKSSQTCTVYCHGDGRGSNGNVSVTDGAVTCSSCHKSSPSSGHHTTHQFQGIKCDECHADVNSSGTAITNPDLHVDGTPSVKLPSGISFTASSATCDGSCHGENHSHRSW